MSNERIETQEPNDMNERKGLKGVPAAWLSWVRRTMDRTSESAEIQADDQVEATVEAKAAAEAEAVVEVEAVVSADAAAQTDAVEAAQADAVEVADQAADTAADEPAGKRVVHAAVKAVGESSTTYQRRLYPWWMRAVAVLLAMALSLMSWNETSIAEARVAIVGDTVTVEGTANDDDGKTADDAQGSKDGEAETTDDGEDAAVEDGEEIGRASCRERV